LRAEIKKKQEAPDQKKEEESYLKFSIRKTMHDKISSLLCELEGQAHL
jgi:hypothetical protein